MSAGAHARAEPSTCARPAPPAAACDQITTLVAGDPRALSHAKPPADAKPAISTPKLAAQVSGLGYHYYAGFSPSFVGDILDHLQVTAEDVVLDAWNGSGTTTLVCAQRGIEAVGTDLSPAMVVVGKGRLHRDERASAVEHVTALVASAPPRRRPARDEPLKAWFKDDSAHRLRTLVERVTQQSGRVGAGGLSNRDCFVLTALFVTVRSLLRPAMTSNPTWVRRCLDDGERIGATWEQVARRFVEATRDLEQLEKPVATTPTFAVRDTSHAADAALRTEAAPVPEAVIECPRPTVLLTSPPYCTRIDYVASTRPELALMGWTGDEQERLRRLMLGTTTVESQLGRTEGFGPEADALLAKVSAHSSRASSTYYRKWLAQYLDGYQRSIVVLTELMAPGSRAALVVQDSFYKDIHIDLALITRQMCEAAGWVHESTIDFDVPRTMASINSRSRPYRESATVTESLLILRTGQGDAEGG